MIQRARLWLIGAVLFTLVNLAGALWAAAEAEPVHSGIHVALTLVGAYLAWRLAASTGRQEPETAALTDERIEQLQQSVDAVALEVERIGEAQRFNEKLQAERAEARP